MADNPFLDASRTISATLREAIRDLVGTEQGGAEIRMGADQTPTEMIDDIAESLVLDHLREAGICQRVISEEAGVIDLFGGEGTVYLDPIDGTYNAVAGIPFYALSLAYARDGQMSEGYVMDLASGEEFYAARGSGAFLDGQPISVSTVSSLHTSAMSLYGKKFDPLRIIRLGSEIRRWRLFGASALELCYVACGRIDGFVDLRNTLRITDAAAGMLICTEAGGVVSAPDGGVVSFPDDVRAGRCMVATNAVIHRKVIEYLR
ncbi:bifunctional fructose-bisphosphatase/inositol-phosphate phosphatase [Methanocalculus taiwanensis]|uniref:fructose-bisphosphatase n=1 Tax=Methanocalculus taiwanensis TaxID=106207 RepID=A0ABD4TJ50_9EURY|nr:bifunctional fructose-bisphosphatase/inositol-phosphate phosphatase [Methanocalculus taiwanensis]MCQ1537798.1 bifunctional fructose-bisphosphatase/inositol-phosphate phosphatase [Methanocalculus taiwanensis]